MVTKKYIGRKLITGTAFLKDRVEVNVAAAANRTDQLFKIETQKKLIKFEP